jgi:uncharacterized protein (DUF1778 family)
MASTGEREGKVERLEIRLTTNAKSLLSHAAQMRHTTISEFMLSSAVAAAEDVLASPKIFFANAAAWDEVMGMLREEATPVPNAVIERVRRALRED